MKTAPRFVPGDTTGSDYLLDRLGASTDQHKRLGDAAYEQRLVLEQLMALTGRRSLDGSDGLGQYRALMDNATQVADGLGLVLGAPLTVTQIGALDQDIVWLVEQVIDGQTVLVPVVYLSRATAERLRADGALIAGEQMQIQSSSALPAPRSRPTIRALCPESAPCPCVLPCCPCACLPRCPWPPRPVGWTYAI